MLQVILCIFVIFRGFSVKEYRFITISVLAILHSLTVSLNTYENMAFLDVLKMAEIALLIALAAVLIWCAWEAKGKRCVLPSVFAVAACAVRFFRSAVYGGYVDAATQPGADTLAVFGELAVYYEWMNETIEFCILMVLVCLAWQLRKKKQSPV